MTRLTEKMAALLVFISAAAMVLVSASVAQTATGTPVPESEGLIPAIVHVSSDTASWLSGRAVEYAGSPLWTTLAGVLIIALIVSLYLWLRRPRKPVEARAPM